MRHARTAVPLVLAGAFMTFAVIRMGMLVTTRGSAPCLAVNLHSISFGRIPASQPAYHRFKLTNTGGKPLLILETKSNCECTIGHLARRSLAPGQSTALDVTFTPKKAGEHRKVFVLVKSNDPQHPLTILTLTADVVKNVAAATTGESHL